jgi:RsiW-degrading membrane proteinase PrsW (M82 family)
VLGYALAITLAVVAWGYLVWAAIDFGSSARDGEAGAWWLLGLAAVGAVACLFAGLMLVARLVRTLSTPSGAEPPPPRRAPGGKRAAR